MPLGSGDRWAEDYERGRPGWPAAVAGLAELPEEATVLDLGAGTGKLTRMLVGRFARVIAVEPADAMRRLLVEHCPGAEAIAGRAEEIPLPDASVDAVFAAQAFHRFEGDRGPAEIARVLRPRGAVVLTWNLGGAWEPPPAAAERLLAERGPKPGEVDYDPLDLGGPRRPPAEILGPAFASLREERLDNPQTIDRDGLVAFYASMGWLADLSDDERLPLVEQVRSLVPAGEYRRVWETQAVVGRRA
jgi:SAM-dependent methyltransferase